MTIEFTITNTKGAEFKCLIDDRDKDLLDSQWHIKTTHTDDVAYVARSAQGTDRSNSKMHRVVMSRILKRDIKQHEQVDHIDRNGLNNTRANLRLATTSQNQANKKIHKNNAIGVKGVTICRGKFQAKITFKGKARFLGSYDTLEEARNAYIDAAKKLFGEFARFE